MFSQSSSFTIISNYWIFKGAQLVDSSKATIITSFVPLWCAILGAIFLKEFVNILTFLCIIGSSVAIYILSLSKHESSHENNEGILGYILILDATWLTSAIFIFLRFLWKNKVKMQVPWFYIGLSFLAEGFLCWMLSSHLVSLSNYTMDDAIHMNIIGILSLGWISCMYYSNRYVITGLIAIIINIESLYKVLIDTFYYHVEIVATDKIGMILLGVWIATPVIYKIVQDRRSLN